VCDLGAEVLIPTVGRQLDLVLSLREPLPAIVSDRVDTSTARHADRVSGHGSIVS
jgi:hypothetical protein